MRKVIYFALGFTIIDQIIKNILVYNLSFQDSITIINGFFNLTLISNTGAAFSILNSNILFLIFISFVALIIIYFYFIKDKTLTTTDNILYGMLIGGIMGNLIDRISRGYVVDFLDVNILNFPVFNFADIFITISIILIIFKTIIGDKK